MKEKHRLIKDIIKVLINLLKTFISNNKMYQWKKNIMCEKYIKFKSYRIKNFKKTAICDNSGSNYWIKDYWINQ